MFVCVAAERGRGVPRRVDDDQSATERVARVAAVSQRATAPHVGRQLAPAQHRRRHRGDDRRDRQPRAPAGRRPVAGGHRAAAAATAGQRPPPGPRRQVPACCRE